jgi:hypothetical protein
MICHYAGQPRAGGQAYLEDLRQLLGRLDLVAGHEQACGVSRQLGQQGGELSLPQERVEALRQARHLHQLLWRTRDEVMMVVMVMV